MAKAAEDSDALTFYLYIMAFLTVIVGGFALWSYQKVDEASKDIKTELRKLKYMEGVALEDEFRSQLAREREGQQTGGGRGTDFRSLYIQNAQRNGLNLVGDQAFNREIPGGVELTYRLQVDSCRVEPLMKFLVGLEEQWPGARVKQIIKLDFNSSTEKFDAVFELSIFKAET